MRKTLSIAGLAAIVSLAVAAPGASAQLSGTTTVTGAVATVLAVVPQAAVTLGTLTPGSATPATATGALTVTSNASCYDVTAAGDVLSSLIAGDSFTNALEVGTNPAATTPLTTAGITLIDNASNAILEVDNYTVTYEQPLAGETVSPAPDYTTTVTYTGAAC